MRRTFAYLTASLVLAVTFAAGERPSAPAAEVASTGSTPRPGRSPRPSPAAPSSRPVRPEVGPWPSVQPIPSADGRSEIADGELLVRVADGGADAVATGLRAVLPIDAMRPIAGGAAVRVRLAPGTDLEDAIAAAGSVPGALGATANAVARGAGRDRRDASAARDALWNVTSSGLAIRGAERHGDRARFVVALLDSGVSSASPSLAGREIVAPLDAIDDDLVPQDENGHGTFLANLLVGWPGLAGDDAALMPVRVLDASLVGTEAALIDGIHHAVMQGADVINLSLVFGESYLPTQLLDAAVNDALSSGVVVVAAAGNDGDGGVRYPAAFPGVVAVGAATPSGRGDRLARAPYSSRGAALDLLAPGGDLDADRNHDGLPDGVLAESFDPATGEHGLWLYAGTSQAAAHVSAAAVRLLGAGAAAAEIPGRLRETARRASDDASGGFERASGGGTLELTRALSGSVRLPTVGVQATVALREQDAETAAGAIVAVAGDDGTPVRRATVWARLRGTAADAVQCTTDRDGVCTLDGGIVETAPTVVVLEIEAVTLRDGTTVRPRSVTTMAALAATDAAIEGGGWGASSILWLASGSFTSFYWPTAFGTWQLFGSGEGSALPPTVVALDDEGAAWLRGLDDTVAGGGWGASSLGWITLAWQPSFFVAWTWGGGWGASSLAWTSFPYLTSRGIATVMGLSAGSPVHDVVVASGVDRCSAASVARTP